ncbi:hypothetical protein RHMOL_Rhmol11G0049100 [Rhododendron molle]|uniref:Uncharacterized protein n=1 Tax=Rhododendron molle TaxID=49168 RepID=A0ACC0LP32_RHOML|nr:hypothetical protein RHMOL_Rhmol11G0049100 [Rhododendron molle]
MMEEEDNESNQSEVIDLDMSNKSDEEERAKEEKLRKWEEHSWAKHNLEIQTFRLWRMMNGCVSSLRIGRRKRKGSS